MGTRGPAPTPTNVLKMRGSWLAKTRHNEPTPQLGAPEKPEFDNEHAGAAWDYLVPLLEAAAILSLVDRNALERYCILFGQWKQAARKVHEFGLVVARKKGDVVIGMEISAYFKIELKLSGELRRLELEFGLSPAARARMAMAGHTDSKPTGKERFFA